jgi:hypothetical protein
MSLLHHTLTSGATTRTLADWNIVSCVVKQALGGEDTLQFTVSGALDVSLFPAFALLTLRDPLGVTRFKGVLTRTSRRARGRGEERLYTCESPSYYLRRAVYRQQWWFVTNPVDFDDVATIAAALQSDPASLASHFGLDWTSQVILNRTSAGEVVDLRDQVTAILDYAIGEAEAPIAYDTSGIPATIRPPLSQQSDLRILDALRNQLQWVPHINWRWQYSDETPLMLFGDTTAGDAFAMPGQVSAVRALDLTGSNPFAIEFAGDPRRDLLVPGVEITYIYGTNTVDADDATTYARVRALHRDASPVIANGSYGIERLTCVLQGDIVNYVAGLRYVTNGEPVPPDGLAAAMLTAYARPYYDLKFSTKSVEVDWTHGAGERFNVLGATPDFAAAEAIAQTITRDIGAGVTSWQCGPPTQLAFNTRLELLRASRLRRLGEDSGAQQHGLEKPGKTDPPPTGMSGLTFVDVTVCGEDGSPVTLHVATKA